MRTGKEPTENGLDAADLAALVAALGEGKRPTVYLKDPVPGLGLPAGASAKVVAVEGATVRLRPRGVADELPFEAGELRASRTLRAAAKTVGGQAAVSKGAASKDAASKDAASKGTASKGGVSKGIASKGTVSKGDTKASGAVPTTAPVVDGPSRSVTRRAKAIGSVTIAVSCDDGGNWSVSVAQGERRPSRPRPVAADAVEKAIAELGDPAAEAAVRSALDSARVAAARRVEELSRQLDEARSALEALQ